MEYSAYPDKQIGAGKGYTHMKQAITKATIDQLPIAKNGIPSRKLGGKVCEEIGVRVGVSETTGQQEWLYFPLYEQAGFLRGYQCRKVGDPDATHFTSGVRNCLPLGSHLAPSGGKFLIVVEGGEDMAAAYSMLQEHGKSWRVVATMGTERWRTQLDYLKSFEKVVIAYDMDKAGRDGTEELAFALGQKAYVASWDSKYKDPDELHKAGQSSAFIAAVSKPAKHTSSAFVTGAAVWEFMKDWKEPAGWTYPPEWKLMNFMLEKMREGEISMWAAPSGVGKSTVFRRLKNHLVSTYTDLKVGEVELEENKEKTVRGVVQSVLGKAWKDATPEERKEAVDSVYGSGRLILYDHRSEHAGGVSLMSKLEYMHYALGCRVFFVDHVTLAVNSYGDGSGGLQQQDAMMEEFLTFAEKTKSHIALISHIRKSSNLAEAHPPGGKRITMEDLKGSGALFQIPADIISLVRDRFSPHDLVKRTNKLDVLKCRETGREDWADYLCYDLDKRQYFVLDDTERELYSTLVKEQIEANKPQKRTKN